MVLARVITLNMVVEEGDGDASLILAKTCFAKFINISVAMWKNLHVVMDSACPWTNGFDDNDDSDEDGGDGDGDGAS